MTRALVLALALLSATACTIGEDDFSEASADAFCDRSKQCDDDFDDIYDDKRECFDAVTDWQDDVLNAYEFLFDCDYDGQAAAACVRAMRAGSCADFLDGEYQAECGLDLVCGG